MVVYCIAVCVIHRAQQAGASEDHHGPAYAVQQLPLSTLLELETHVAVSREALSDRPDFHAHWVDEGEGCMPSPSAQVLRVRHSKIDHGSHPSIDELIDRAVSQSLLLGLVSE
eukprot:COSAG05_NODE_1205_length_5533_cov_1.927862_3_plen_113_part_00